MKIESDRDIEKLLESCRLKAAPPGLRERILGAAHKDDGAYRRWKMRLKLSLVSCSIFLFLLFIAEAALSHSERIQIQALVDGRRSSPADVAEKSFSWAEVSGDAIDSKLFNGRRITLVQRRDIHSLRRDQIKILKEDFEDHENSKNID